MEHWTTANIPDITGKTALVTGANSGLGFETSFALATKGAQVLMACRSLEKGSQALAKLKEAVPAAHARVMLLDLASQQSIREFWKNFRNEHDRLDLLINNAGVMIPPLTRTADGFELQMGTNHLGHFTLTGMLLENLIRTPGARIVNVSSGAHQMGRADISDLNFEKRRYWRWQAYGQSKLANLWFTYELDRRLKAAGHDTLSVAAHPGYAATNLQRYMPLPGLIQTLLRAQSSAMGALPLLYAAVAPDVHGGEYFGPDGWKELRGYPRKVGSSRLSRDEELARRFWFYSEDATGCIYLF